MKIAVAFVVGCFAVLTVSAAPEYTTKYDNIDLDKILMSERLLKNYFDCLLGKGNCTPDGKALKAALPDAIANECATCTEKQRNGANKVLQFLIKNKAAMFDELAKVYDKDGTYKAKYLAKLKEDANGKEDAKAEEEDAKKPVA